MKYNNIMVKDSKSIRFSTFIIICSVLILIFILANAQGEVVNLKDFVQVSIQEPIESNGGVPVNPLDKTTPPLDLYFVQLNGTVTTLAQNASVDSRVINVTNVTDNIFVGTYIIIASGGIGRFYTGEVLSISGNLVTLDTPIDFNFSSGFPVIPTTRDLNVDGSVNTQTFFVGTTGMQSNLTFDITRVMIHFKTSTAVSLATFGDLPSLTNGLVLRRMDGDIRNIFNVKNNGDIANLAFDYDPHLATNPAQGQNGANFRYTFAGADKHGVVIRLSAGEELQALVQDDLTSLQEFRIIAEGHITQN